MSSTEKPVPYYLIRTKRITMALQVRAGEVIVRAPFRCRKEQIDAFVLSKNVWVQEMLQKQQALLTQKAAFRPDYGSRVLLCGKEYPITERQVPTAQAQGGEIHMPPGLDAEGIRRELITLYRRIAKQLMAQRGQFYAQKMDLPIPQIRITGAKTRWGSCSGTGGLQFSWRLVMADMCAIDYVVVHDLCHLRERNHQSDFWEQVQAVLPDYKLRQLSLLSLQKRMERENWDDQIV